MVVSSGSKKSLLQAMCMQADSHPWYNNSLLPRVVLQMESDSFAIVLHALAYW